MSPHICSICPDEAIVEHRETTQRRCLTHAMTEKCSECDHTKARCPILGCGVWRAVNATAGTLLLYDVSENDKPVH